MTDRVISEVARWGRVLRDLRKNAELTQGDLGRAVNVSGALISGFERGTRMPNRRHIEDLDSTLSTGGTLARTWAETKETEIGIPKSWQSFVAVEREAVEIREYATVIISGLLQSEGYARAVIEPDARADDLVRFRLGRMARLRDDIRIWVLLEEAAARRVVGSSAVQVQAVERLLDLATQPHIRMNIIPMDSTDRPGMAGSFRIARVPDGRLVGHCEYVFGEVVVHGDEVVELMRMYDDLKAAALSVRETRRLLEKMRNEFDELAQEQL
ncbi:helix-turn-helix domain-containing protein [Nocardiopsis suaedae]|uniref:Helix-turn-helix transcriptional regulator n=1 Tax=Nocardiopsis suaedae TaxID=3018444 RepID=A0ABT4TTM0_9ACTN|nr:helix-turn-helix transcriptional regulator [Nocardiopsis suaedae]MDA2807982.1 helix-turn-helix transcriptional regulator [Nocardiopsis suaedae]